LPQQIIEVGIRVDSVNRAILVPGKARANDGDHSIAHIV